VLTGAASRVVLDASAEAAAAGVRAGMSAAEARVRAPGLVCREQDVEAERAAAAALLDVALAVSPRVEAPAPGEARLDLAGLPGVPGPGEARLAGRLAAAAAAVGLPARVALADTRAAARLLARARPGPPTLAPPGRAAAWLAPLPVAVLAPPPDLALTLERWGIRTLGELARLPRAALLARLGPAGTGLQAAARGEDRAPFVPHVPPETWVEACALDWEVAALAGLAFVLHRLLERLGARLAVRDLGATALRLTLGLAGGATHVEPLALAAPLREPRTLLALLRAALERRRLAAPVTALRLEAEVAPLPALQADLFAPPRPSPRELGETLGRLVALVGPRGVGAPRLDDTHRPDAAGVGPFPGTGPEPAAGPAGRRPGPGPALACRRLAPPLPAAVECRDGRPTRVEAAGVRGAVTAAAGPWLTTGEWWAETAWTREEWDVALSDGAVYRLARDLAAGAAGPWSVEAVYD
jgi:protein ImuB